MRAFGAADALRGGENWKADVVPPIPEVRRRSAPRGLPLRRKRNKPKSVGIFPSHPRPSKGVFGGRGEAKVLRFVLCVVLAGSQGRLAASRRGACVWARCHRIEEPM